MSSEKGLPTDAEPREGGPEDANGTSAAEQKRQEIRQSILALRDLAQTEIAFPDFCQQVMNTIIPLTAAYGAVVWYLEAGQQPEMVYATGPASAEALVKGPRHQVVLADIIAHRQPTAVPSQTLRDGQDHPPLHTTAESNGDPSEILMLFAPIVTNDGSCWGVFELLQRAEISEPVQQGYLKFVSQVAALFIRWWERHTQQVQPVQVFSARPQMNYTLVTGPDNVGAGAPPTEAGTSPRPRHGSAALRESPAAPPRSEPSQSRAIERLEFVREVHQSIQLMDTVYSIANAARRLLQSDRVCVAVARGTRCKVKAISSQDRFDNRSNVIKKLGQLAQLCVQSRTTLWLNGDTSGLAPQLNRAVNDYLDEAHSRTLAVIPLEEPPSRREGEVERRVIRPPQRLGALIIEYFARDVRQDAQGEDLDLVVQQSAAALSNAAKTSEIFLAPLWLNVGRTWRWLWDDHRKKTAFITGLLASIFLMLCFWPATMRLKIHGVAQPEVRRNLFTQVDGVIERVFVEQNARVKANELLLEMDALPLRLKRVEVAGQIATLTEQIQSLDRQFAMRPRMPQDEALALSANVEQMAIQRAGLEKQLELIDQQLATLNVYSPIDGIVLTWDTKRLEKLPVQANQPVLTVADVDGPWHLELLIPQGKLGYITRAMNRQGTDWLPADFILATDPNHRYRGRLVSVAERGEMGPNGEVEFRAIVALEADQTIRQQPGAGVTVRVACGKHPLGLVWFHQIIDYVRTRIFF